MASALPGKLIILRHGESEWNARGVWTGTTDVHLTAKGHHEARLMGEQLRGLRIDRAYVSEQIRTTETLKDIIDVLGLRNLPWEVSGAINERDYGIYTGKNKWQVQKEIGEEAFVQIRRGWDVPIPSGETLRTVYNRTIPFYLNAVLPELKDDQNVLIVAHGNSIRSLMKYIESISDIEVANLEMIFGTIVIYDVNAEGKLIHKEVRSIRVPSPPN